MGWEYFGVVRFNLGPLLQGETRIAKLKSAYNCCYWSYRFGMVNHLIGNHGLAIFGVDGFDLGSLLQGETRIAKLKNAYNSLNIMSTPLGGGHIIFAFSAVWRPSHLVSGHFKEKYLSYLYQIWYGCLLG